ncbi:MAG: Mrp/NBP35 family ATP-binding protein [Alphaproteobacteria bacterium]|nr:Mrp/NBP35 family ATP-binding protein [Alphaproteobacteria bacterium]
MCEKTKNPPLDVPAKHIIAVASGKGGVGKSTIAANLAVALAKSSKLKIGLLDADIYGPSQPFMMGDKDYKPLLNDDKKLIPAQCHGVYLMSIGFIADQDKALIWRGPMAQSAFYQMIRDVDWAGPNGEKLDVLVIDLPPGTGDIQLTMVKKLKLSGAVIVSTPQDIALIDARRAVAMFEKTGVPVLGLIENMSVYICPECGHEAHIFGNGGARMEAKELDVLYLGDVPLARDVREYSDQGTPIVLADPEDSAAQKINEIAGQLKKVLSTL